MYTCTVCGIITMTYSHLHMTRWRIDSLYYWHPLGLNKQDYQTRHHAVHCVGGGDVLRYVNIKCDTRYLPTGDKQYKQKQRLRWSERFYVLSRLAPIWLYCGGSFLSIYSRCEALVRGVHPRCRLRCKLRLPTYADWPAVGEAMHSHYFYGLDN